MNWEHARAAAFACAQPLGTEQVLLADAIGRVNAEPLLALTDLPSHSASAMDGWAVNGEGPWKIVGEVRAGSMHSPALGLGEAVTIATGAALPSGTDAVIRSEDGSVDDDTLTAPVVLGSHIRPAGEEARAGDQVIAAGSLLTPLHIGLAAAAGHDTITVHRRPRVRIAIFGDELLREGRAQGGRIRDSLGPQLPTWLTSWGCEVIEVCFLPDTLESHRAALEATDVDVVITTGGTAHGPVDFLHHAISSLDGELIVDGVDCRPGHPMLLARWPRHFLIGLPGNPQAAIAALHTLGAPLIRALLGMELPALDEVAFEGEIKRHDRQTRLIPCTLKAGVARPMEHIGSGMLRGLTIADGFAVVTATSVGWLPLQRL